MENGGRLEIKQHVSESLESRVDELMERIEQEVDDDALEALLIPLVARVRAASEVTRQILAVEAEVGTHRALQDQLAASGSEDLSTLSGKRADDAQERLDVLTDQLAALKGWFDV